MDKLFQRNFDLFSNNNKIIERLCDDEGDGSAECPYKADCRFKEIKSGENRQEIIECISNCDETDIAQFPLTRIPGTTSDKSQLGKNNMYYIASKPVIVPERPCPEGFQKNKTGDCCSAKPDENCDINCLSKKCSNYGWVNNQFSKEEYGWNDFQCCPNGSCTWNSTFDKDKGVCVGKIDERAPIGLSDEVFGLKSNIVKLFILRNMVINDWVTLINSGSDDIYSSNIMHWSYDDQWNKNHSNSNQIYQQFRYFANFVIKNYGDGPWSIPVYTGNYSSFNTFYGNLSFQKNTDNIKREIQEKQNKEHVCNKKLLPNDECMFMYGPWLSRPGLIDYISVNDKNEKVYIKFDHIYTKMVSVTGESRYYQGPVVNFKPCHWTQYNLISNGLYIIRKGQPNECDCNIKDNNNCISMSFFNNSYNFIPGNNWFDKPISNDTIQMKDYIQTKIFEKISDNINEKINFPILSTISKWRMDIELRLENYNVEWSSIIGNMYNNSVPGRGWGLWINRSLRTLHFSGKSNVINLIIEKIELNVDYKITVISVIDRIVIQLENLKKKKKTFNNLIKQDFLMNDDIGMATIGGRWDNYSNGENFGGKIRSVIVYKLDDLNKYKKYSKELSKAQCNYMGLSNWTVIDDTFTCDNISKSKLELECDFTDNSRSVFKDYKILDNKNVAIGLTNPSVQIEGLDQLGFKNKLYEMYYRNGGNNPQKNEANNVYEYWNKCKNVRGYSFLKDMNLLDPNSNDFKCYYKNSNQCIFKDFIKDGDSCVSSTKDLVYSSSNLSALDQNQMIKWLEDLNEKNDGDDMKSSWSAVSYDYWTRCKGVEGLGVPIQSFDPNILNKELKATFYEHCDYQGRSIQLGQGSYDYNFIHSKGFNDIISSIKVPKGLRVVVFEHDLNNGRSLTLIDNNPCLINNSFNDIISSIIVINIDEQTRYLGELEFKKPRKKRGVETCDTSIIPGTNKSCSQWATIDTKTQYNNGLPRSIPLVYPSDTCWTGTSCTDPKNLSSELDLTPYWSFNLRDKTNNSLSNKLVGKAKYQNGYLNLSESDGFLETEPIKIDISEKTLEAWVVINNIEQSGGGIITIQTKSGDVFDGINYGENPQKWNISSENSNRTIIKDTEIEKQPEILNHLVAVYNKNDSIELYKNGKLYLTKYTKGKLSKYKAGEAIILLGNRNKQGKNNILNGIIYQAALYDYAISAKEVGRLYKNGITGCPTIEEIENAPLCPTGTQVCLNLSNDRTRVQDKYCYDPSKNSMVSTFFVREYDKCSLTNEGKVSGLTERTINGTKVWFRQSGRDQCASQYIDSNMIGKIKNSLSSRLFGTSVILSKEQSSVLKNWFVELKNAKLLYRATRDGFNAKSFHKLCDGMGSTITIVQTNKGDIFGGFTNIDWRQSDNYYKDNSAFLFTLSNPNSISPTRISIKDTSKAVLVKKELGPSFGNDIVINFQKNTLLQESYTYDINNMLTKSNEFIIEEMEVWNIFENDIFSDSLILKTDSISYFKNWLSNIQTSRLLYRGSQHGWNNRSFHNNVDGNNQTITIIKTVDGFIFGGFTGIDWGLGNKGWVSDTNSFLFTIKNPYNISPIKITSNPNYIHYAIFLNQSYGPTFGGGHDLYVNLDNKTGYINVWGYTQGIPRNDLYYGKSGGTLFNIDEIEIYGLNSSPFMGSTILNIDQINKLSSFIPRLDYVNLVYSGIRDTIDLNKFHEKCANKSPLLILLTLNDGNKIGCYITVEITRDRIWSGIDYDSFLFDLRENDIYRIDENNQLDTFNYGNNNTEYIFLLGNSQFGIGIKNNVMTFFNNSKGGIYKNSNNNQFILNGGNQIVKQIEVWNVFLTHPFFKSEQITHLTLKYEFPQLIKWLPDLTGLSLLFRAKEHGFTLKAFHDKCDMKGPTLIVFKTASDRIIGGCNFIEWGSFNGYVTDKDAFLFNIVNNNQFTNKFGTNPEINHLYISSTHGPTFGGGHDLYVNYNNKSINMYTSYYTDKKRNFGVVKRFQESYNEIIQDYEVWSMQFYSEATNNDLNMIVNSNNMDVVCNNNYSYQTAINKCNEMADQCNFITMDKKLSDKKSIGNACFSVNPPIKSNKYVVNEILTFEYTGKPQLFNVGNAAKIKIEVYGAAGGPMGGNRSIEGGISRGTYTIKNQSILYVYVGGMGIDGNKGKNRENVPGGWNGGGDGGFDSSSGGSHGASGGGATDVRLKIDDLHSRIIVAGGGGGSNNSGNWGGKGGGLNGEDGYLREASFAAGYGTGGSQNAGGQSIGSHNIIGTTGILGKGGNGSTNVSCYGSGGGGGGYYGGGGGAGKYLHGWGYGGAGGGGSGYIGGVQNGSTNTIGGKYGDGRCIITILEIDKSSLDDDIPDFNSKFGTKTSGTSFELNGWKLVSSIGTYGNEGLPAILSKVPPPLYNTDNDYPRIAGFLRNNVNIGIIGPKAQTLIGVDWYGSANFGSQRNAQTVNLYGSNNDHSNNMTQNFIMNNSVFLGNFIVPKENITTLNPFKVKLNPRDSFKSYYFVILDNYGDSSVKVGSIHLHFSNNTILKKKYIISNSLFNVTIPTSEIQYQNRRLVYYNNNNFPYLNQNLEGLNRYIAKAWGFAQYANRIEAPMSSVLSQYGPNPPFLYGNNWESSWWCLNNVDNNNELLLIEFDIPRNVANITAKNWDTYVNDQAGELEVLTVLKMSNNQIIDVKTLGSINLRNSNQIIGILSLNQSYKNLLFQRKNITGWSKLENIIIN